MHRCFLCGSWVRRGASHCHFCSVPQPAGRRKRPTRQASPRKVKRPVGAPRRSFKQAGGVKVLDAPPERRTEAEPVEPEIRTERAEVAGATPPKGDAADTIEVIDSPAPPAVNAAPVRTPERSEPEPEAEAESESESEAKADSDEARVERDEAPAVTELADPPPPPPAPPSPVSPVSPVHINGDDSEPRIGAVADDHLPGFAFPPKPPKPKPKRWSRRAAR